MPGPGAVTGPRRSGAARDGIAAEPATSPWSGQLRITCVGVAHDLGSWFPDRVEVLPDVPALRESLPEPTAAGTGSDTVLTGWAPGPAHPATAGQVILVGPEPSPAEARHLAQLAAGGGRTPRVVVGRAHEELSGVAGYEIGIAPDGRFPLRCWESTRRPFGATRVDPRTTGATGGTAPFLGGRPARPGPRRTEAVGPHRRFTVVVRGKAGIADRWAGPRAPRRPYWAAPPTVPSSSTCAATARTPW